MRSFGLPFLAALILGALLPGPGRAYTSNDYYQAGLNLCQQKNYAGAVPYLKAAVQMDPTNWQAYQVLGYSYYMTNDNTDALNAYDQSLRLNPNNPSLRSFADNLRAKTAVQAAAPAAPPAPVAPARGVSASLPSIFGSGTWANLHAGVAYATLGDMATAPQAVQSHYSASIAKASSSGLGFLGGGEGGISFDSENAIGLAVNVGVFGGYQDSLASGGYAVSDSFSPVMFGIEPKYHHFIPMGQSRLNLEVGPGFYVTSLQVDQIVNGTNEVNGPMSGFGFGGVLGAGWDFAMENIAIEIFAHGRYASTSNIQGEFKDPSGNTHQMGLIMNSQGFMGTAFTSYIGQNGLRWANVDYTGLDAGIGITYHY